MGLRPLQIGDCSHDHPAGPRYSHDRESVDCDRMPLPGRVWAVTRVPCPVAVLDHPEAALREQQKLLA